MPEPAARTLRRRALAFVFLTATAVALAGPDGATSIDMSALPKDAVAEIDGARVKGVVPVAQAGKVTVRLTRPGFFAKTVVVEARAGESVVLDAGAWDAEPAVLAKRRIGIRDFAGDRAIGGGVDWLLRHQAKDGHWSAASFCKDPACSGAGSPYHDVGVTALATLALLGAGSTSAEGKGRDAVASAVKWLTERQDKDGCVGARDHLQFLYDHGAAAMALTEDWWLTHDPARREPAQRAVAFLEAARNPGSGWRYGVRDGQTDTASTVWMSCAMLTAEVAGLEVDPSWKPGALAWIAAATETEFGKVGYLRPGRADARIAEEVRADGGSPAPPEGDEGRPALPGFWTREPRYGKGSLMGLAVPTMGEWDKRHPVSCSDASSTGADFIGTALSEPPRSVHRPAWAPFTTVYQGGVCDLHGAVWSSLWSAQTGTTQSQKWRPQAVKDFAENQAAGKEGCHLGSWDPAPDPFGVAGGRVYATSMALLALEAPNRFPKLYDAALAAKRAKAAKK